MAMLAEKRRKTKFVLQPVSKPLWNTETSGRKIMEKMGWSAGKGLGANEQGISEPIRAVFKQDTKGVGFQGDGNPFHNQDEFNAILANLASTKQDEAEEILTFESLEEKSQKSKARVHYKKYTRGKDLSRYSTTDLACIVGNGKKEEVEEDICEQTYTPGERENAFGVTTVHGGSIADYFKLKWKKNKVVDTSTSLNQGDDESFQEKVEEASNIAYDENYPPNENDSKFDSVAQAGSWRDEEPATNFDNLEKLQNMLKSKKPRKRTIEEDISNYKVNVVTDDDNNKEARQKDHCEAELVTKKKNKRREKREELALPSGNDSECINGNNCEIEKQEIDELQDRTEKKQKKKKRKESKCEISFDYDASEEIAENDSLIKQSKKKRKRSALQDADLDYDNYTQSSILSADQSVNEIKKERKKKSKGLTTPEQSDTECPTELNVENKCESEDGNDKPCVMENIDVLDENVTNSRKKRKKSAKKCNETESIDSAEHTAKREKKNRKKQKTLEEGLGENPHEPVNNEDSADSEECRKQRKTRREADIEPVASCDHIAGDEIHIQLAAQEETAASDKNESKRDRRKKRKEQLASCENNDSPDIEEDSKIRKVARKFPGSSVDQLHGYGVKTR